MKTLALSLLGAAAMAVSSNAMAIDTTRVYVASLTLGGAFIPVGTLLFDFDSQLPPSIVHGVPVNPGACAYLAEWLDQTPAGWGAGTAGHVLPLSGQCYFFEQMTHGAFSCIGNSIRGVPSMVLAGNNLVASTAFPVPAPFGECDGVDPFGQISAVLTLQVSENLALPGTPALLQGIVQFDGLLSSSTIYGLSITG